MQACQSCAASKSRCDNDRQCNRCRSRGKACVRSTVFGLLERSESDYIVASNVDGAENTVGPDASPYNFTASEQGHVGDQHDCATTEGAETVVAGNERGV